jgi:hypothetical protein
MTSQQVKEILKHMWLAYAHISVLVAREGGKCGGGVDERWRE